MPQDELWAASARTTGLMAYFTEDVQQRGCFGTLSITPMWSKRPTGRDGSVALPIDRSMTWAVPEVFTAAFDQWLNGDPKHVPIAARSAFRDARSAFGLSLPG
jgi:hypothetical protein